MNPRALRTIYKQPEYTCSRLPRDNAPGISLHHKYKGACMSADKHLKTQTRRIPNEHRSESGRDHASLLLVGE